MNQARKKSSLPVKPGLYQMAESPGGESRLLANRCPNCEEIFFPKRHICQNCQGRDLENIALSRKGKIFSFTTVMQKPASHYRGPVPYSFGWVELPEGIRVESLFTGCKPESLEIGLDVEMVIERLHEDEQGNETLCHKFRPSEKQPKT